MTRATKTPLFHTDDHFEVSTPQGPVYGTLQVPNGAQAATLFIGGSGPHDRNGRAGALELGYEAWAQTLIAKNLAVLRIDKPGSGDSPMPVDRPVRFSHDIIRNQTALNALGEACPNLPLAIIGHSLGALIGLELKHERLSGLAHLCGAGRTLDRLICDQILSLLNKQKAPQEAIEEHLAERLNIYQTFARGEVLKDLPPWTGNDVEALIWIGDACRHDPVSLLSTHTMNKCLLMGTRDDRIYDIDWTLSRAAAPKAPSLLVEGMDHFLKMPDGKLNQDALSWVADQLLSFSQI